MTLAVHESQSGALYQKVAKLANPLAPLHI